MSNRVYLWMDLETSGLDPSRHSILEVAAVLTDTRGRHLSYWMDEVISYSLEDLDHIKIRMSKEVLEMHSQLLEDIYNGGDASLEHVEDILCDWVQEKKASGKDVILAGHSIQFDRAFLKVHMPKLEKLLHYRMLDVRSLEMTFPDYSLPGSGQPKHRAGSDLRHSFDVWQHIQKKARQKEQGVTILRNRTDFNVVLFSLGSIAGALLTYFWMTFL